MRREINQTPWLPLLLCAVLAVLGMMHLNYVVTFGKLSDLLAGAGILYLLATEDLKRLRNLPSVLLLAFAAYTMLSGFWAIAGKFFLREYGKLFVALLFFLYIVLCGRRERGFLRRVLAVVAGISALYAFGSVEAATTGVVKSILRGAGMLEGQPLGFAIGNYGRLYGVFGNSNIEASVYAIGALFSVALLCGAPRESRGLRVLYSVTLSFCVYGFLLVFSMGAIVCFAAAVVIYLIFAGTGRSAALLRFCATGIPTLLCGILTFRAVFASDGTSVLPLALMLVNAAITAALELTVLERATAALEAYRKLAFSVLIGAVVLVLVYAAAGLLITGPYTFGPQCLRGAGLSAGEHTVAIDADAGVKLRIYTQDRTQSVRGDSTVLYEGPAAGAVSFSVPGEAGRCYFTFSAEAGKVIRSAVIDGSKKLSLNNPLFPLILTSRIQNLTTNNSQTVRAMYVRDAFKLIRQRPVFGYGTGAFETGISSVQDYPYETKYVHNHYVQVLLEGGVVGFALFVAAMISLALALWKQRGQKETGECFWIYPALCAEFVMNALQMFWDVSMSIIVFLCFAYTLFGLIVLTCCVGEEEPAAASARGTGKAGGKSWPARLALLLFPIFFLATVLGNLYAGGLRERQEGSYERYLENFATAARIDLYEHNDSMLSYVMLVSDEEMTEYQAQADIYAGRLSRAHSNSIPYYLIAYYYNTLQYDKCIDAAMLGATYSVSDADTWNSITLLLKQGFTDPVQESPLLTEDGGALLEKLTQFCQMLDRYPETALKPIQLNAEGTAFFDTVRALGECGGDRGRMAEVLAAGA